MKRLQVSLVLVIALAWAAPAQAQLFFRKPAQNPSQRVPELILTVKTDAEERKRAHAAEELREYDAATFSEIVPVLVDVLQHDKKVSVRLEALNSLAKIRPAHPLTAPAIEKAAAADESWRVRWQAKSALTKIQVTNFVAKKSESLAAVTRRKSEEPAAANAPSGPNTFTVEVMPPSAQPIPRPMPTGAPMPAPLPPSVQPAPAVPTPQGPQLFP